MGPSLYPKKLFPGLQRQLNQCQVIGQKTLDAWVYVLGPRVTVRTLSPQIQLAWPACRRERKPSDSVISGPLRLQTTIGTQTDETTPPQIETLEESETPAILKETVISRSMQPESHETQCEGRRRADIETPDGLKPEFGNP